MTRQFAPSTSISITRLAVVVALAAMLTSSCTIRERVAPDVAIPQVSAPVERTVGLYFSPEFRAFEVTDEADPVVDVRLRVGEDSMPVLRAAVESNFASVVEIDDLAAAGQVTPPVDAVIEPRIDHFALRPLGGYGAQFDAEIHFGITLRAPAGEPLGNWTAGGRGSQRFYFWRALSPQGLALKRALGNAAVAVARSFREQPEAVRWLQGLPPGEATAPAAEMLTESAPGGTAVRGIYPGIVAASADPANAPDPASEFIVADLRARGAWSLRLEVENIGSRPLRVRSDEILLTGAGPEDRRPVPGETLAQLVSAGYQSGPIAQPPQGSGAAGIVATGLQLLIEAALLEQSESETAMYELLYGSDQFPDGTVAPGAAAAGYVHFLVPPEAGPRPDSALVVPVVDPAKARRYVLRLPLPAPNSGGDGSGGR